MGSKERKAEQRARAREWLKLWNFTTSTGKQIIGAEPLLTAMKETLEPEQIETIVKWLKGQK